MNDVGICLHNYRCIISTIFPSKYTRLHQDNYFGTMLLMNIDNNVINFHKYM